MENNRGEVTIPFVITMIVSIIIIVVAVFMLTGENGLFVPKEDEKNNEVITNNTDQTNNTVDLNEQNSVVTNETNTVEANETFTIIPVE